MALAHIWICLVIAMVSQSIVQLSPVERYLYVQLEDALVNDAATLEQLREVFFEEFRRSTEIHFQINITVESILPSNYSVCSPRPWNTREPAFCSVNKKASCYSNTSIGQWKLCSLLNISWATALDAVEAIEVLANTVVPWSSHGLSCIVLLYGDSYILDMNVWHNAHIVPINLLLKTLNCQPHIYQLSNAVGELFSWVKVYTDAGEKPQNWGSQQQGVVQLGSFIFYRGVYPATDIYWKEYFTHKSVFAFGLVGCCLLTLSLLLLIPRLFLIYYNKVTKVTKEASPGSRSLYWGTAVVSLFLAFVILLAKLCLLSLHIHNWAFLWGDSQLVYFKLLIASIVVELFIPIMFLLISLKTSRPVPMPAAKFTTHVLFCCCCCFCCSSRCKSKGIQILTLWAFMTFIYYNIMEAVAVVFTLSISIPLAVSCTLTYVSVVFFAIMFLSIILFSCHFTGMSKSAPAKCLGVVDVCAALICFCFIILVFAAVIAVFINLKVSGLEAVSLKFSVLPSIALSVAGWLIRKKLLNEDSHTVQPVDQRATGHPSSDGRREDEHEQSPGDQQYLLV